MSHELAYLPSVVLNAVQGPDQVDWQDVADASRAEMERMLQAHALRYDDLFVTPSPWSPALSDAYLMFDAFQPLDIDVRLRARDIPSDAAASRVARRATACSSSFLSFVLENREPFKSSQVCTRLPDGITLPMLLRIFRLATTGEQMPVPTPSIGPGVASSTQRVLSFCLPHQTNTKVSVNVCDLLRNVVQIPPVRAFDDEAHVTSYCTPAQAVPGDGGVELARAIAASGIGMSAIATPLCELTRL